MADTLGTELSSVLAAFKNRPNTAAAFGQLVALLQQNIEQEQKLMSQITDWAVQEQADLTAIAGTLTAIQTGVQALDALIVNFQNSPGTLSAADQAALDGIEVASKALVTQAQAISVTPPAPTTTAPPTA